jgi:hypothetical protein
MSGAPDPGSSEDPTGVMPPPITYVSDTRVALEWSILEAGSTEAGLSMDLASTVMPRTPS